MKETTFAGRPRSRSAPPALGTTRPFDPVGAQAGPLAGNAGHDFAQVNVNAPVQRVPVPAGERIRPDDFMRARAHLAARFLGAPVNDLRADVERGRQMVNGWASTAGNPVGQEQSQALADDTVREHYTELKRFQSEAGHFKPRSEPDVSAFQQVRNLHGSGYGDMEESPDYPGAAFIGARHTKGYNESSFVSLLSEPEKLLESKDTGPKGAQTIAQKAAELHTYTVPKHFVWNTDRLSSTMYEDDRNGPIDHSGTPAHEWLASTPKEEGEELFLGGDLDRYRTGATANPFLPKPSKGKKGKKKGK